MFTHTRLDKRQHSLCRDLQPLWRGFTPILKKPARDTRQIERIVTHIRAPVHAIAKQIPQPLRKGIGNDAGAFDQPGIAIARPLARFALVDQQDGTPARLQVQCRGNADNARPQNNDILLLHWHFQFLEQRNKRAEEDRRVSVFSKELIVLQAINRYRNRNISSRLWHRCRLRGFSLSPH